MVKSSKGAGFSRLVEALLNRFAQFTTEIDGLDIHFLHVRSPHPEAMPLIVTHGWPGSVVEFHKVIEPLTNPTAHGGNAADAFHVVCPSLPGFGFSAKPSTTGWGVDRIAAAWAVLMARLGYARYGAQGGDWGSAVTTSLGAAYIGTDVVSVDDALQRADEQLYKAKEGGRDAVFMDKIGKLNPADYEEPERAIVE